MALGQLHRGVHCGSSRDALHTQHLIEAEMQQPTQPGRLFMGWNFAETVQPTIEPLPPANASIGQFGGQTAIRWRQGTLANGPL